MNDNMLIEEHPINLYTAVKIVNYKNKVERSESNACKTMFNYFLSVYTEGFVIVNLSSVFCEMTTRKFPEMVIKVNL